MKPLDIQHIGEEIAIKWVDGSEMFIPLERFRRACPCAGCKGEGDILGNLYKGPEQVLTPLSFQLRQLNRIGTYAVQPVWGDGHSSGIYSFDYLRSRGRVKASRFGAATILASKTTRPVTPRAAAVGASNECRIRRLVISFC